MTKPSIPIRLVVLDLDGTTLNPQCKLNAATVEAIRRARRRGVRIVLASGRMPRFILGVAQQLELDGVHIGLNGGVAFDSGGALRHKHTIPLTALERLHQVFHEEALFPMVYGPEFVSVPFLNSHVDEMVSYGEPVPTLYDPGRLDSIADPVKVLALVEAGPRDAVLSARLEPHLHAVRTGERFFEFMAPGVSKGAALQEYLDDLNLERAGVMAVGDSENDASLFAVAGFSVAMANAVPSLLERADAVTESNARDGVARALHRWVLDF